MLQVQLSLCCKLFLMLPRLKKFNVSYTFADGTVQTKTITAGEPLGEIIKTQRPGTNKTVLTVAINSGLDNCSESTVPQKDVTYHETFKDVDCTYDVTEEDGVITSKCNVCGYVKTEIKLNYDAYNAAVTKATGCWPRILQSIQKNQEIIFNLFFIKSSRVKNAKSKGLNLTL